MSTPISVALVATVSSNSRNTAEHIQHRWPGILLCGSLAFSALILGQWDWLQIHGVGTLTVAIVLGMVVGNTVFPNVAGLAASCGAGVAYSKQSLLRLGIVLYGLRLTVQDIGQLGISGILIDALVLTSTFLLAMIAGPRWLGVDRKSAMLIGAGSSICGAAAVMAVEPVVRARAEHVTVAIATVVAFGTISIFLYPALFLLNEQWQIVPGGESVFGIYIGSTVHEVAQVVAAARSVGAHAADTAVIEKMVRVVMLAPFLIALSAWLTRASSRGEDRTCNNGGGRPGREAPITIPWFAFGFLAVVLLNSLHSLPTPIEGLSLEFDNFILAMAMAALGLSTHVNSLRQAGVRPLLLALLLYVWLLAGGAAINCWVPKLISII